MNEVGWSFVNEVNRQAGLASGTEPSLCFYRLLAELWPIQLQDERLDRLGRKSDSWNLLTNGGRNLPVSEEPNLPTSGESEPAYTWGSELPTSGFWNLPANGELEPADTWGSELPTSGFWNLPANGELEPADQRRPEPAGK